MIADLTGRTVLSVLQELTSRDIRLSLRGEALHLSAPEGALTPQLRSIITMRKAEIVAALRAAAFAAAPDPAFALRRAPSDRPAPLSFAQQRLWFLHQLNPRDPVYNLTVDLPLPELPDVEVLTAALRALVQRHAILRTIFRDIDGVPMQVVTEIYPSVRVLDAVGLEDASRTENIQHLAEDEARQPFDLQTQPPFRATLVRSGTGGRLLLGLHHIAGDGWSLGVLVRELRELYEAARDGQDARLAPLALQYADYAYSERTHFDETDQRAHAAYWTNKLRDSSAPLELPMDHPRPKELGSRGAVHSFTFPPALADRLRALARDNGVTLYTPLLTTFKILLHRYTGRTGIIVGTPIAHRGHVELESLIGLFVGTVVLKTDLSGDPTVRTLLTRVRDELLNANEHAEYPFEKIVELARPDRSLGVSPLFQTSFVLLNTPDASTYRTISAGAGFELSLFACEIGDEIQMSLAYNRELYEPETIARMAGHLRMVAEAMVANPDARLSTISLVTPPEARQLMIDWNDTVAAYPIDEPVHAPFEAQAARIPQAASVRCGSAGLTYRELEERANQLAHHLIALGVRRETRVGICLDRSVDVAVAILGVLKAGAAYVPIDPRFPPARAAFIARDAELVAVVTATPHLAILADVDCEMVALDREATTIAARPVQRPESRPQGTDAAYVLYTSGSTGQPKGAVVEHGALRSFIQWMTTTYPLAAREPVLHSTNFSFDVSVRALFWPLACGAEVIIAPSDAVGDPSALVALIRAHGAVSARFVPALLARFIEEEGFEACGSLRWVFSGGEAMASTLEARFFERCDAAGVHPALINTYGPTEATINVAAWRCDRVEHGPTVPIGRPIANTRLYVLDEHQQLVPVGVPGELYVGGLPVCRGYLNRPELTARSFVPDVFSADPTARLYRTGDRVRWRPEGVLEFLTRTDSQIKLRGYRIELGEIEAALWAHPAVSAAAVVPLGDRHGDSRLVAYVVARPDQSTTVDDLRADLRRQIPDYMVPETVVWLDALPLTPNGKLDREALPAPGARTASTSAFTPPADGLETTIANVWRELLGVERVGADDNFFDLGGHSLLVIQLQRQLRTATGCQLTVADLFRRQTVRTCAEFIASRQPGERRLTPSDASGASAPRSCVAAIQPDGHRPPLFVVPGISGEIVSYGALARSMGTAQPIYGLRSVGIDGDAEPLDRVEAIAERFVNDIRRVQPHGPYHLAGVCVGGLVAYEMAQRLVAAGERVALLAMVETWSPDTHRRTDLPSPVAVRMRFVRAAALRDLNRFRQLTLRERFALLRSKLAVAAGIFTTRDVYRGDKLARARDLVMAGNRHAASHYEPRPYPGRVAIVLSREGTVPSPDPRLVWRDLAKDAHPVVTISARDSGQALQVPHVAKLAAALGEWITGAVSGDAEGFEAASRDRAVRS